MHITKSISLQLPLSPLATLVRDEQEFVTYICNNNYGPRPMHMMISQQKTRPPYLGLALECLRFSHFNVIFHMEYKTIPRKVVVTKNAGFLKTPQLPLLNLLTNNMSCGYSSLTFLAILSNQKCWIS